ncbi:putative RNA-binding protein containing Zn ribbon [Frankia sp. CcI6]|uniref:DUF721 domain-containing protein n=1 Tax=Frankia TaxID=1854 RepID=UPI0003CFDBF5|nr:MULTISPECIES: DciA family protein [Frankia]ETA03939.1 putative RNA-binding protein containing Zn ribbon [Frankia sp. CcI6]KFB06835.1 putative RNA-binding protein containing Zn ribbon [Frankia sp. Allo2]OAA31132.1 putative RNA-binding protein containing Zn ribbon [Frankia casuarinae]
MPTERPDPRDHPTVPGSTASGRSRGGAGRRGKTEGPDGTAAHGADLAREILAQVKRDARERGRGRWGAGHTARHPTGPGPAGPGTGRGGGMPGADGGTWADEDASTGATGTGGPWGPGSRTRLGARRADPSDDQVPRRPRMPGIAPPGREWREPVGFGTAINRLLAARGWKAQASDANVLARWDAIVGPDIADHCTPVSLRDGDLELVAESTAWATQLRMLSRQLLGILHRELGPHVVRRIVVRGPTAPSWRHGSIRTGGRGPRDTYG